MNPFTIGPFNRQENNPRPVICMVYALAAQKPVVQVMEPLSKWSSKGQGMGRSSNHSFTSFDIWCGHMSLSTFRVICPEDNETYRELLKQSMDIAEMFELDQKSMKEVTMSMYPGATRKDAHWMSFFDITDLVHAEPLDDKELSGESDSDNELKQYIGLSVIIPTIQLSLHMYAGRHAFSSKPEASGLSNCLHLNF